MGRMGAGLGLAAPTASRSRAQLLVEILSSTSFGSVCSRYRIAFSLMRQRETNRGEGLSAGKWQSPRSNLNVSLEQGKAPLSKGYVG